MEENSEFKPINFIGKKNIKLNNSKEKKIKHNSGYPIVEIVEVLNGIVEISNKEIIVPFLTWSDNTYVYVKNISKFKIEVEVNMFR